MNRLSKADVDKLSAIAKKENKDATIALIDDALGILVNKACVCVNDHRFVQGGIAALKELRDRVVLKLNS